MLLSIIIPMYNAERFITGCLTSLYNQNMIEEDFEVIVINDGSHDSSEDLVREFQKNRSNIKLITQKNQGQSVARNRGIKEATGRYLCFVDADDFWIPGSFEKVYSFLLQLKQEYMDPLPDMITFGIEGGEKEYSDFNKIGESLKKEILKTYTDGKSYIARNNYNNGPWWYCLSREFIDRSQLSFMVGKLCEDGMFTMNALLKAGKIIQIMGGGIYYYAVRSGSTTSTLDENRKKKLIEGFLFAIDYFVRLITSQNDLPSECRQRLLTRVDSYAVSLLGRLMLSGDYRKASDTIRKLKEQGIYPIKHYCKVDYLGRSSKIRKDIVNMKYLYLILCMLMNLRNQISNKK